MSVFAVPRSIARSREKSLYSPLNMERSEPWRRVSEARDASKEGQVTQPARARGYARVPDWPFGFFTPGCRRLASPPKSGLGIARVSRHPGRANCKLGQEVSIR